MEYTLHPSREQQCVLKDAHHSTGLCFKNYLNYSRLLGQSLHPLLKTAAGAQEQTCSSTCFSEHHSIQSSDSCFLTQVPH